MIRCDVYLAANEVPEEDWGRVADRDGLCASLAWLATIEAQVIGETRYLLVRDGAETVAALPVYLVDEFANEYYDPAGHFTGLPSGSRYCLAGGIAGYRNQPSFAPGLASERFVAARQALFASLSELVDAHGCGYAAFLFLTEEGFDRIGAEPGVSRPVLGHVADTRLFAEGAGLDDYFAQLPRSRRRYKRRELHRFEQAGLTIQVEDPREHTELIVRLFDQVNRKYGRLIPDEVQRAELVRQFDRFGASTVLFTCRDERGITGLSLALVQGGWLYLRGAGFDYPRLRGKFEYFNLSFYGPLRYCYEHGLRGVHLGPSSPAAKVERGATIRPLVSAVFDRAALVAERVGEDADREARDYWTGELRRMHADVDPAPWKRFGVEAGVG